MKKRILFIFIFLLMFLFLILISSSKAAIDLPVFSCVTYDGYSYENIPDIPEDISGYSYYVVCNYYNYNNSHDDKNTGIVLLYSNSPFFYFRDGDRCLLASDNCCDLGYYYYLNANSPTAWKTSKSGMHFAGAGSHFYFLDGRQPTIFYSNYQIIDNADGSVFYSGNNSLYITHEDSSNSDNPIRLCTNWFDIDVGVDGFYSCYIWIGDGEYESLDLNVSLEEQDWVSMNVESSTVDGNILIRFYYDVGSYGTYYFCFENSEFASLQYLAYTCEDNFSFYLSNTESTSEPIYLYSTAYYYDGDIEDYMENSDNDFTLNYDVYIAVGLDSPYEYNIDKELFYDEEKQMSGRRYEILVTVNGVYKLKIYNRVTDSYKYQTFIVDNIMVKTNVGEEIPYNNYDEDGNFRPTPVLFLEYLNMNTVRIRTQPFTFNEIILLECYFSPNNSDFEKINNIYTYTDSNKNNLYYFYYDVSLDGTYTFKFYNLESKKYTQSSIDVNISQFVTDNVDKIDSFSDKMYVWGKAHFGILFYPFELLSDFLHRIMDLDGTFKGYLYIPELRDPIYGNLLFGGFSFNFNGLMYDSKLTNFLYFNVYLPAVDFLLFVLFIKFCIKTLKEV